MSFLQAVKTLQLNVLLIVRHCRQQGGGGEEGANTSYISILFIICIYTVYVIDHIDVCLCICKMTLQRNSLKFIINVIQIDTCTTEIHFNFYFLRHL